MSLKTKDFKNYNKGDRPSASDLNNRGDMLEKVLRSLTMNGIMDSTGILTRKVTSNKMAIRLYEVQSAATGDGIYNCYEQVIDSTEWDDTAGDSKVDDKDAISIEVLNLAEFDPESNYVAHLAAGDLMLAFKKTDDENNTRWIGVPFRQANADRPRIAYCSAAAGASQTIAATLDHTTGTAITVTCLSSQGNSTNLNACVPRLADNDPIMVTKIGATWHCLTTFQPSEDCDCYSAP